MEPRGRTEQAAEFRLFFRAFVTDRYRAGDGDETGKDRSRADAAADVEETCKSRSNHRGKENREKGSCEKQQNANDGKDFQFNGGE
jgi:hypothetical protein